MKVLDARKLDDFRSGFKGAILLPGEHGYESARTIWNATVDKHPAGSENGRSVNRRGRQYGLSSPASR